MGYVETAVNVSESNREAQLTVAVSMPPEDVPIETSFSLLVNTATGLLALECEFGLCICSTQSENLCNLDTASHILRIPRLCSNFEIAHYSCAISRLRTIVAQS